MSVIPSDIKIYGSANMQEDDTSTPQGGAIDETIMLSFQDLTADQDNSIQIVSSNLLDTTQYITVYGRNNAGSIVSDSGQLNNFLTVDITQTFERLLKCIKSASTDGDIAVEESTATHTGIAQAGYDAISSSGASIILDAGASASDDYYNDYVLRLDGGTGNGQIRKIIDYDGTNKSASVNVDWNTTPDDTTTFVISKGIVFEKTPNEVLTIRRPFYNVGADDLTGSERNFYEKCFIKNENDTKALLGATVIEYEDLTESNSADITFALEPLVDSTGISTNRITAPTGSLTFNGTNKAVPGTDLQPTGTIGMWLKLTLDAGAPATNTTFTVQTSGTST